MFTTSALPAGSDHLFAVYTGDAIFASSTSSVIIQVVLAKPGHCDRPLQQLVLRFPRIANIQGRRGTTSSGSRPARSRSTGPTVTTASRAATAMTATPEATATTTSPAGTGTTRFPLEMAMTPSRWATGPTRSLSATAMTRWPSATEPQPVMVGNGNDVLTFGSGSSNQVSLGSGADTVTIQGSQDTITGSSGNDTVYLGGGREQLLGRGPPHQCLSPTHPPLLMARDSRAYYHDTLTNCTVVTP